MIHNLAVKYYTQGLDSDDETNERTYTYFGIIRCYNNDKAPWLR
jgi:hypothetical protein